MSECAHEHIVGEGLKNEIYAEYKFQNYRNYCHEESSTKINH